MGMTQQFLSQWGLTPMLISLMSQRGLTPVCLTVGPSFVATSPTNPPSTNSSPNAYIQSNLIGFYNILEACRQTLRSTEGRLLPTGRKNSPLSTLNSPLSARPEGALSSERTLNSPLSTLNSQLSTLNYKGVQHLIYASSSSVYGGNKKVPFSTDDRVDNPVSLYAATKKSNELMAHCYSKLYDIPTTGLRFFTVYGPAGRPDMAYFGFTNKLLKGETIQIYNYGNCRRDFTYVDDIVEPSSRKNSSVQVSSPRTSISRPTNNWSPCNPAMSPPPMPTPPPSSAISVSPRKSPSAKASANSPSGTNPTTFKMSHWGQALL